MFKLEEKLNGKDSKEDMKLDDTNGVSEVRKRFLGVSKKGNKWQARVRHPKLKFHVSLGCYSTAEEAALVVKNKKAEFEEMFKGEDSMNVESCKDDFEGKKLPPGVYRRGYRRWGARIWEPKLKYHVSLGSYDTPEEAAAAMENKRAEFLNNDKVSEKIETMSDILDENSVNVETCRDDFEGRKLPSGVYRRGHRRWGARIWDPKLKYHASLGSYDTPEEAAIVVENRRAEFLNLYGWSPKVKPDCKDNDKVPEKIEITSDIADEPTDDLKVPKGVRKRKSGEKIDRTTDPKSRAGIWLGSFNTAEDAVRSSSKAKAEFAAKVEFDQLEFRPKARPDLEASALQVKIECSGNVNIAVDDKSSYGVATVPDKLKCKFVHGSPSLVFEPENSDSADVSDKCVIRKGKGKGKEQSVFDLEEAMRTGFINEYGQLVGEYSELDGHMEFSLPDGCDEVGADIGYC